MTDASATAARRQAEPLVAHHWGWTLARGVLALALGVLAIVFPANALFAFTLIFAAFLFVDGALALAAAGRRAAQGRTRWWAYALRGLAGVLVGILFMLMPFVMTLGYAFATVALLAGWSISVGILEIIAAIRLRKEIKGEWLLGLSGALSVLLGVGVAVLLALFPAASMLSVAWMIGVYAIAAGILLTIEAVRQRRRAQPSQEPSGPAKSPAYG